VGTFGRYRNALHFRDGLFSDIYKSKVPSDSPDSFPGKPGELVALKVTYLLAMRPPHDSEREVRILKKAASEHVIPLWETFNDAAGHLVLVFPFMPLDLERLLQKDALTKSQAKGCLKDLFNALAHLHSLKIIHRDVKPSNIVLRSASGPAYLADFGIAWCLKDPASEPGAKKITDIGTTCYRAPELLFGLSSYGKAVDLWAAGCVVAEATSRDHASLFDSGELGSDLSLVHSIFKSLGTPNADVWPVSVTYSEFIHRPDDIRKP
jgi:serine/threonine protein kinase